MKSVTAYWSDLNWVSIVLWPMSLFYCLLVFLRRLLYRLGLLGAYRSALPVIVVGNIYIGGNGKTPLVIELVEQLKKRGYKPGVVSRGYGAYDKIHHSAAFPWPRRVTLEQAAGYFGDEPVLIHQATQCPVFIDPQRSSAVQALEQQTDCNVIISDDGLQHYALQRDIEINVTDARRLYGNGLCLPAGPLRESCRRLNSVDYIVYNISRGKLSDSLLLDKRSFSMNYTVEALQSVAQQPPMTMTLETFKGKIVHTIAAIGEPDAFFRLLKSHGLQLIEHPFPDHYQFQEQDLNFKDDLAVIMTAKDAVKCRMMQLNNCWYLPIKADISPQFFEDIERKLKTRTQ